MTQNYFKHCIQCDLLRNLFFNFLNVIMQIKCIFATGSGYNEFLDKINIIYYN